MIADTSFIIDLLRNDAEAVKKAEELESKNRGFSLSSITVYELCQSISQSNAEEKEDILDIITSQPTHSLDRESAEKAGKIQEKLMKAGERIGHLDVLIAGITAEKDGKVLTSNESEFRRVNEIEVEITKHKCSEKI